MSMAYDYSGHTGWPPHVGHHQYSDEDDFFFPSSHSGQASYPTTMDPPINGYDGSYGGLYTGHADAHDQHLQQQQQSQPQQQQQMRHQRLPAYSEYTTAPYSTSGSTTTAFSHYGNTPQASVPRFSISPPSNLAAPSFNSSQTYGSMDQLAASHMHRQYSDGASSVSSDGAAYSPSRETAGKEKRHSCTFDGCESAFARKADRDRHITCVHDKAKRYPCRFKRCSRKGDQAFTRKDHLREHERNYHKKDVPKRKSKRNPEEEDDEEEDEEDEEQSRQPGFFHPAQGYSRSHVPGQEWFGH